MKTAYKAATLALGIVIFGALAIGCGSSACDDYKQEISDCCDKISDDASKESCNKILDSYDFDNADDDACQAAADAYKCAG